MGSDGARRGDRHPTASLSCSLSGGALAVEVPSLWTCGWTSLMGLKKEGQSAKRWPLLSVRVLLFRCHWMRRPQQAGGPDEVWSHHRPPPPKVSQHCHLAVISTISRSWICWKKEPLDCGNRRCLLRKAQCSCV